MTLTFSLSNNLGFTHYEAVSGPYGNGELPVGGYNIGVYHARVEGELTISFLNTASGKG
ncbi:MAG: hypothetical protein ACJA04_000746 [Cellvibrionaceae bacterium]|jgi:hypothetical protein